MSGEENTLDNENDKVVMEVPVYLSKQLETLYIFQNSVRPRGSTVDNTVIRSRIKPVLQEVELEVGFDTKSSTFNDKKAEDIARRVDSSDDNKSKVYESGMVDRQVLTSGPHSSESSLNYAVGKMEDGALHLCPVKSIIQLQPSFAHGEVLVAESEKSGDEKDEVEEALPQKVSVKFQRHESERTKKLRAMTYSHYMKKRAEERWNETHYCQADSPESELERSKILCSHPRLTVPGMNLDQSQYLRNLVPYKPAKNITHPGSSAMVSIASLKSLTWLEKIKIVLLTAKIVPFGKMTTLLTDDPKEIPHLLLALQTQGIMIRGNWTLRSELLYPECTRSRYNGVPASIMCRARDYLLTMFYQQKYVSQIKFIDFVKIPREEAKEMLTDIAMYYTSKGWDLIFPDDDDFMERYPEVAKGQQKLLEDRRAILDVAFKEMHEPSKSPDVPRRQRKKSGRDTSGGTNDSSNDGSVPVRRRKKSAQNSGNF
ncbi:DNA-directed RNA polymerase III subunit RPC5-like [Ischnura elegans]|uniref:DNA-directed RNA polymerase III subunit RPC5-like n=1 Tax=Ischnura elegans TaxID=197161 RepID=UPI001ED8B311|nr:DNA-directed RNA polymerase III subunit RPC5-like [Ischnura elegans]